MTEAGVWSREGEGEGVCVDEQELERERESVTPCMRILNSFEEITAYNSLLCHISSIVCKAKKNIYNHQFRSNPLHEAH